MQFKHNMLICFVWRIGAIWGAGPRVPHVYATACAAFPHHFTCPQLGLSPFNATAVAVSRPDCAAAAAVDARAKAIIGTVYRPVVSVMSVPPEMRPVTDPDGQKCQFELVFG